MKQIVRANVALILALSIILPNSSILAMEMEVLTTESEVTPVVVAEEMLAAPEEVKAEIIVDEGVIENPVLPVSDNPVLDMDLEDIQKEVTIPAEIMVDASTTLEMNTEDIINDVGFDDSNPATTTEPVTPACVTDADELARRGDIDRNGVINNDDVRILALVYNTASSNSNVYDIRADFNADGEINFADLVTIAQNYRQRLCVMPPTESCVATLVADINNDKAVDFADLTIFADQYRQSGDNLSGDFDRNGTVDFADLVKIAQEYGKYECGENPVTPVPEDTDTDNGGSSSGSRRRSGGGGSGSSDEGEVLGAAISTTCSVPYMTEFVFPYRSNSVYAVGKLQSFLNQYEGANVMVNGMYDAKTQLAVRDFQKKYATEIIKPWHDAGLLSSPHDPTGVVYLTTQRMINMRVCPNLTLPLPALVPAK